MQTAFQRTGKPFYFNTIMAARGSTQSAVRIDKVDRVFHGRNLFRRIVGDFNVEFFFERHDEFDNIKAVCAQIVDEAGFFRHFVGFNAQMLDNNLFNALSSIAHFLCPFIVGI
jgi:hypothetical protein